MEYTKVFGKPSFPKDRPPTVGDLISAGRETAVRRDYTKDLPRTIVETHPENKMIMNTMLIKTCMSALLRDQEPDKLKYKIKKSKRDWVTENMDNYREHVYDPLTDTWRFNYKDSALDRKEPSGPFMMSKLAASTMCESGYPCTLHKQSKPAGMPKVKHVEETDSVKANIGPEAQEKRSHDFDDINTDGELLEGGKKEETKRNPPKTLLPSAEIKNGESKAEKIYYPKIISSSFVRKTKKKDVYDMEK